jgi:Fe2+ transport system protein B
MLFVSFFMMKQIYFVCLFLFIYLFCISTVVILFRELKFMSVTASSKSEDCLLYYFGLLYCIILVCTEFSLTRD